MKIVDENGKLFKRFNLVDTIVVLLLAIIVVAIGWKVISASITKDEPTIEEEIVEAFETSPHLIYDVVCCNIPKDVAHAFEAQMKLPLSERQLMSSGDPVDGYLTGCTIVPNEEDDSYTVYFTLEAIVVEKDDIYSVGTQEVRIGKGHIVKTYNIETSGYVYTMEVTGEVEDDE